MNDAFNDMQEVRLTKLAEEYAELTSGRELFYRQDNKFVFDEGQIARGISDAVDEAARVVERVKKMGAQ